MTDTYTSPQSSFAAPESALAAPASVFAGPDLANLDRNFRRITQIEGSWRLPRLPTQVKADLIMQPGADENSLAELLLGMDQDMHQESDAPSDHLAQQPTPGFDQPGYNQARVILAAVTSNPPPQSISADAVRQFKLKAIERGLLDQQPGRADSSWSPEFNRIRGEMAFDDYNAAQRGNRPGAVPVSRAMQFLNDVTSPAGLLSMATDLDLFWDFGNISREWSSWGDKWRALADAKNPLDWAGKAIDALTGPIDDIVFPIINDALLITGIGSIANVARVGWQGTRLIEAGGLFSRLYSGDSLLARTAVRVGEMAAGNLEELSRPSMIANRLMKGAGLRGLTSAERGAAMGADAFGELGGLTRGAARAGDALADWRGLRPVVAAKHTVQQGMRLGLTGRLESWFPGYQGGGASASDIIPGVDTAGNWLQSMSMAPAFMPLELMFAPYNIFAPGTFFMRGDKGLGLLGAGLSGGAHALGTIPGRTAAGALIGAAAGTIAGDDAGDIARGAAIGGLSGAALPALGRALEATRIHQGVTGTLIGGAAGAILGDSPEDIATGALAGAGMMVLPNSVRRRIYDQAGISGLDKLMHGVGTAMVRTSFQPIERDQEIALGFHRKMQRLLAGDPEKLGAWEQDVKVSGVVDALAKRQGAGREMAAATIAFDYTTFATDWIASAQAGMAGGSRAAHAMARNKIINQLRPLDLGRPVDDLVEDVATALAWTEKGGAGGNLASVYKRKAELAEALRADPTRAVRLAEEHNNQIADSITQLFDQRNFPKPDTSLGFGAPIGPQNINDKWAGIPMSSRGDLFAAHGGYSNFGDFPKFTESANDIRQARLDQLFDPAKLKPVTNRRGYRINPLRSTPKVSGQADEINRHINDLLVGGRIDMDKLGDTRLTPLAGAHEAGRFTQARIDTPTKQDLEGFGEQVADVLDTSRVMREQGANWKGAVSRAGVDTATPVSDLSRAQFNEMVDSVAKAGVNKKTAHKLADFARYHELSLDDMDGVLRGRMDELSNHEDWTKLGFDRIVTDAKGRQLYGEEALRYRYKELRERIPFTASEVDMDELERYYRSGRQAKQPASEVVSSPVDEWAKPAHAPDDAWRFLESLGDGGDPHYFADRAARSDAEYALGKDFVADHLNGQVDEEFLDKLDSLYTMSNDDFDKFFGQVDDLLPDDFKAFWNWRDNAPKELGAGPAPTIGASAVDLAKADRIAGLKVDLEKRGYKLVHGTEFLMPEDLAFRTPTFNDITRRHMNSVTLGNWFGARKPVEGMIRDDRRRRLAIVNRLAEIHHDVAPDDPEVSNILDVLRHWLNEEQDVVGRRLSQAHLETLPKRTLQRMESSFTPVRIDDIGGFAAQKKILDALHKAGISEDKAMAIWRATNDFRNTDFKDVGLYAIESYLRTKNVPASFLKMLAGSRYGDSLFTRGVGQAATGAVVGAVAGVTSAATDATQEEKLKRALLGGVIGAGAGAGVSAAVTGADRWKNIIQGAENWRYGYLADGYARLRDAMRFTLSPIFDASRYTEGLFLAQTAAPARAADGSRMVLPGNMSPWALRRTIAKGLEEEGHTALEAKRIARVKYDTHLEDFKAAARQKDFDPDAIDSAGQWFRQVGILGFSPTDWMATAYTHLRTAGGLGREEAYQAAREMYAYGSKGRSAAELSVNFLFFPFSFQKKALGHMAHWLNDDLGRSIMLHDALKTYEILDQEYDLDKFWKDHVPWLQQLQRLNLLAYGISPGRFGGINSQLFEGAGKLAWNAFIPVGTNIRDAAAGKELTDVAKQMLPIWNDINWMTKNVQESGQVLFSPSHQVTAAQVRDGYDAWYSYKRGFEAALNERGYTTADIFNKPWLADVQAEYENKQAEIAREFPAWVQSRQESIGNITALNMDREQMLQTAQYKQSIGQQPSPDEQQIADFETMLAGLKRKMSLVLGSTDFDNAPPDVFDQILRTAAQYANENPGWISVWNRFYRSQFGPIEIAQTL